MISFWKAEGYYRVDTHTLWFANSDLYTKLCSKIKYNLCRLSGIVRGLWHLVPSLCNFGILVWYGWGKNWRFHEFQSEFWIFGSCPGCKQKTWVSLSKLVFNVEWIRKGSMFVAPGWWLICVRESRFLQRLICKNSV